MPQKLLKIISLLLCFILLFEQSGLAQVAGDLDISGYLTSLRSSFIQDKFRPLHLRYISYDNVSNNFKLLLDKGDVLGELKTQNAKPIESKTLPLQQETQRLMQYFFIGISLPNSSFWVNLRPDSPDNIIDDFLAQTDVGRILLEADLQLKKDTAKATSPSTPEGKTYWDKLYKKAEELFGYENITIPTLTRPWIVPDEIILRESENNAYIYKATLKVCLEEDYLRDSPLRGQSLYSFKDPRLKALNEYSSQLIRELIIPKLTKEINTSKRYASLRQVYYSLILAQWFKSRFYGKGGLYSWLIDKRDLTNLTSKDNWSKTTYFKQYQQSFSQGEYNLKEPIYTSFGQSIRSYFSGGIQLIPEKGIAPPATASSPMTTNLDKSFTAIYTTKSPPNSGNYLLSGSFYSASSPLEGKVEIERGIASSPMESEKPSNLPSEGTVQPTLGSREKISKDTASSSIGQGVRKISAVALLWAMLGGLFPAKSNNLNLNPTPATIALVKEYNATLPAKTKTLYGQLARIIGTPVENLMALELAETDGRNNVISKAGAVGPLQITQQNLNLVNTYVAKIKGRVLKGEKLSLIDAHHYTAIQQIEKLIGPAPFSWEKVSKDPDYNRAVGAISFAMNFRMFYQWKLIPLKRGGWGFVRRKPGEKPNYPILEATIAAHNLSWGYVWDVLRKYGPKWKEHLPKETRVHNARFIRAKRALEATTKEKSSAPSSFKQPQQNKRKQTASSPAQEAQTASSPIEQLRQGLSDDEKNILQNIQKEVSPEIILLLENQAKQFADSIDGYNYLNAVYSVIEVLGSHKEMLGLVIQGLFEKKPYVKYPHKAYDAIFDLDLPDMPGFVLYAQALKQILEFASSNGITLTETQIRSIFNLSPFDAFVFSKAIKDYDTQTSGKIKEAFNGADDFGSKNMREVIADAMVSKQEKINGFVTQEAIRGFKRVFVDEPLWVELSQAPQELQDEFKGLVSSNKISLSIREESVADLANPQIQEFIKQNRIHLIPIDDSILTRWNTAELLEYAKDRLTDRHQIAVSQSGKLYFVKKTTSPDSASRQRDALKTIWSDRGFYIENIGDLLITEFLIDYRDGGLIGPPLLGETLWVQIKDKIAQKINQLKEHFWGWITDDRPANYLVKVNTVGEIDVLPVDLQDKVVSSPLSQPDAAASPVGNQDTILPAQRIFSSKNHINIHLFCQLLNEALTEEMRGLLIPVLKGSAIYLADENGNVDIRMIGDIDIAFETKGSLVTGNLRQQFAHILHQLCKEANILGKDSQLSTWAPDHEHELLEDSFHEFWIKAPSGQELKISITPTVSRDLAQDIIEQDIQNILTKGPLDNWGRFPGYDTAIKRYLLVLYYLDREAFLPFKERYRQLVSSGFKPEEFEMGLIKLYTDIEEAVKTKKPKYLAKVTPDASGASNLKKVVGQSLYGAGIARIEKKAASLPLQQSDQLGSSPIELETPQNSVGFGTRFVYLGEKYEVIGSQDIVGETHWVSRGDDGSMVVLDTKTIQNALANKSNLDSSVKGSSPAQTSNKGGIDFTSLPIVSQPLLTTSQPLSNIPHPSVNINLDKEYSEIQNMLNSGIIPSVERIREYLNACFIREDMDNQINKVLACIADILRLEEENCCNTDPGLKDILMLLESNKPAFELHSALSNIRVLSKEPIIKY